MARCPWVWKNYAEVTVIPSARAAFWRLLVCRHCFIESLLVVVVLSTLLALVARRAGAQQPGDEEFTVTTASNALNLDLKTNGAAGVAYTYRPGLSNMIRVWESDGPTVTLGDQHTYASCLQSYRPCFVFGPDGEPRAAYLRDFPYPRGRELYYDGPLEDGGVPVYGALVDAHAWGALACAVGADGRPRVAYWGERPDGNDEYRLAFWNGSAWVTTVLDAELYPYTLLCRTNVAMAADDTSGDTWVSFLSQGCCLQAPPHGPTTPTRLRLVRVNSAGSATLQTIETGGPQGNGDWDQAGQLSAMAIDAAGQPHVVYQFEDVVLGTWRLKYWAGGAIEVIENDFWPADSNESGLAIALDADQQPFVAYTVMDQVTYESSVKVMKRVGANTWVPLAPVSASTSVYDVDMAIDAAQRLQVAYADADAIRLVRRNLAGCTLTCSACAATSASAGRPVRLSAAAAGCSTPALDWDYGDGSPHGTQSDVAHTYNGPGLYHWTLTAVAPGAAACTQSGTIDVRDERVLAFPLDGWDADSAGITAVFDHSQAQPYTQDGRVVAYTGEEGACNPGGAHQDFRTPYAGYRNENGAPFVVNGNYAYRGSPLVGAVTCAGVPAASWPPSNTFLRYDGHPGVDYPAACHTPIRAAVSGTVRYPCTMPGLTPLATLEKHVLAIDPDPPFDALRVHYLHVATYPSANFPACLGMRPVVTSQACSEELPLVADGERVVVGQIIGLTGDAGSPGARHLHFEVQRQGVPVDPYGWEGRCADPYATANVWLWE